MKKERKSEAQIAEELGRFGLDYVGGYVNCDKPVTVKCRRCGNEFKRAYVQVRNKGLHCPFCRHRKFEERKAHRKAVEKIIKLKAQDDNAKQYAMPLRTCRQCGVQFIATSGNKQCCSEQCSKALQNRRRDRRLNEQNIVDADITLEKLYVKDNGKCYLCGKVCDWQDFIVTDNATICGDNYPSIEHVKPLSKGGLHSWANVKLACRRCNTIKAAYPLTS